MDIAFAMQVSDVRGLDRMAFALYWYLSMEI
jgi:hypothetical protein